MYCFENPPLPEGEEEVVCDISFRKLKPQDSIVLKLISQEMFVPLVDYLDQDLFKTPPSSEDELSEDEIEIVDVIPFSRASIVEKCHSNEKDEDPEKKEECSKEKASVTAQNIEEIDLYSDDSQTGEKNHPKSKENTNSTSIQISPKQRNASEIKIKELSKWLDRDRYLDVSADVQKPRFNRSPSKSSSKRKRLYQSTGHGDSSTSRRSPITLVCPKKRHRRHSSLDPTLQNSPRAQRHHSPIEWQDSPRYHSSSQDELDERCSYRNQRKSTKERYSSPEAPEKKRQKVIHYIDANSDQGYELSEIKISTKVVKKRQLVPTCQETGEGKIQRDSIPNDPKNIKKVDSDPEKADINAIAFENYYCKYCQITLNSKLTWESHIRGKRHMKAIQCLAVHDIAKGSICIPQNPEFASLNKPRFASPTAGKKLVFLNESSKIQRTVEEHTRDPMPGLDHVIEIRSENVITYYCSLCDAPCQPISIMPHLRGFYHQLLCLREINPRVYEKAKNITKKKLIMKKMLAVLFEHQDKHRKGRIKVYEEIPDPNAIPNPIESLYFNRPGPSWGNFAMKPENNESLESGEVSNDEYLDTSKSDFYCKLCDSHMNNFNMWASHVRGKRHLKNAKKTPGEEPGKKKAVKADPSVVSKLESMLLKEAKDEVIVGLDYIRETQSKNGEVYNCFLCCACATNYDILDHILLTKHRTKYLEKLLADGKLNGIAKIAYMDINNTYIRENLIKGECIQMVEKYGKGKVEVYFSKDM